MLAEQKRQLNSIYKLRDEEVKLLVASVGLGSGPVSFVSHTNHELCVRQGADTSYLILSLKAPYLLERVQDFTKAVHWAGSRAGI